MSADHRHARRTLAATALVLTALMWLGAGHALADVTAGVSGQTLRVLGDADPNTIVLAGDPDDANRLLVDVGGDGGAEFGFDRSTFTAVDVDGREGDDVLRVAPSTTIDEHITLRGSAGEDTLVGGDGPDRLLGGTENDVVD